MGLMQEIPVVSKEILNGLLQGCDKSSDVVLGIAMGLVSSMFYLFFYYYLLVVIHIGLFLIRFLRMNVSFLLTVMGSKREM